MDGWCSWNMYMLGKRSTRRGELQKAWLLWVLRPVRISSRWVGQIGLRAV
jgi:hypothetical protein